MRGLLPWLLIFAAGTGLLVRAAAMLVRAGDEIATRTHLGGLFVGLLLIALATSLPEIVTNVSAVIGDAPDLAVGALLGSNMANMAILAVIDLVHREHVWPRVELGHARVAAVAIALTALAVLGVALPRSWSAGWVGLDTLGIGAGYVAALAWMRRSPQPRLARSVDAGFPVPTGVGEAAYPSGGLSSAVRRFAVAALGILVAGPIIARAAEGIAVEAGFAESFVGASFLAIATSLPELVTALGAVRIGAYDLAVGNLFGSNAINMAVLLIADAAYTEGPLLAAVTDAHIVGGVAAILLMAVALAAIVHGEETRIARLEPDAVVLLLAYGAAMFAVWAVG